jgi:hypothetical protein
MHTADSDENERLLAVYRTQLSDVEKAIRREIQRRNALASIVTGLEALTGKAVIQPTLENTVAQNMSRHAAAVTTIPAQRYVESRQVAVAPVPPTILGAVVRALRKLPRPKELGAASILHLIKENDGSAPNYATLFNALKRGSQQENGVVYKRGPKFGLREWQSKGGGPS